MDVLFNFTFQNWAGILLAFIPAVINWGIAGYAFTRLPKNSTSYLFILFVSALATWQTSDTLMRMTSSIQTADLWYGLLSFAALLISPLGLHFLLFFTREEKLAKSPIILILLYGPVIIFEQLERTGLIQGSIPTIYKPFWGWMPQATTGNFMEGAWIAELAILIIIILLLYAIEVWKIPQKRYQALIIAGGFMVPTIQGAITQVIFPNILHISPIPISSTVTSVFSIATIIAITKFKFLKITPAIANDTIVNTIADIIIIANHNGTIDFFNLEAERIFNIKQQEVEKHKIDELFEKSTQNMQIWKEQIIKPVLKNNQVKGILAYFQTANTQIPVLVSAAPFKLNPKEKPSIIMIAHDVSERLKTEKKLKESVEKQENQTAILTSILNSIGDGVVVADENSKFLLWNPAAERIIGMGALSISPTEWAKQYGAFLPDKKTPFPPEEMPIAKAIKGQSTDQIELFIKNPNQPKGILTSITGRPLKDAKGNNKGGVVIFHDITQHKEYEEKLKINNQKLQEEKAILTSIGDGVIATDTQRRISFLNQTAQDLLGYTADEAMKKDLIKLIDMEDEKGKSIPLEKRPVNLALTTTEKISAKAYYKKKNGQKFPISFTVTPIMLNGKINGTLEIFRDITKDTEIDKAKTEFVSLASHELRTPPTTIKWYAELILQKDKGTMNTEQKKYMNTIHKESLRMISLVNSLLNVSRLELGTFAVTPEPISLTKLIEEIIQELQPQIEIKNIQLTKELTENIPIINLDKKLVQIVMANLLTNSIMYTKDKGKITVKTEIDQDKKQIIVSIEDNGCGIPKDEQDKVFSKFFRADNAKIIDQKGTGLGLYITKSILTQTKGKIWFTSTENKGTTFYISLPLAGMEEKYGEKYLD